MVIEKEIANDNQLADALKKCPCGADIVDAAVKVNRMDLYNTTELYVKCRACEGISSYYIDTKDLDNFISLKLPPKHARYYNPLDPAHW